MVQKFKARLQKSAPPFLKVVKYTEPVDLPRFLILSAWVGAKQHAFWLQRTIKRSKDAIDVSTRYMKQRRVCEDPVEVVRRQVQGEKVLLPDLAA